MKKNNSSLGYAIVGILLTISSLEGHDLRPVPWVTHKAVLFLEKFMQENPHAKVLEFGSGSSTIWFAKRTKNLVSVEHAQQWFDKVTNILNTEPDCFKVNLILHPMPYYCICDEFPDNYFDLIVVDGRNRSGCIKHSIRILKSGGVLMLDNAERSYYQKATRLMGKWKYITDTQHQPDSCGFMYPNWTTSWWVKP